MHAQAEQLVREVVAQLLDLDEDLLAMDQPLPEIPGWDSVNALRVLVFLEREAGEPLDYDAFMDAAVLADLAAIVAEATAPAGSSR
jgi:acyl carrier protein